MNSIKSFSNPQCRACMCETDTFMELNVFSDCQNRIKIYEMFITVTPELQINGNCDKLPNLICNPCFSKLKIAYNFQQMCIKSDKKLRELIISENNENNCKIEMQKQNNAKWIQVNQNSYKSLTATRIPENNLKTQIEICDEGNEFSNSSNQNAKTYFSNNEHNKPQSMKTILENNPNINLEELNFETDNSLNSPAIINTTTATFHNNKVKKIETHKNFLCTICGKVFNTSCNLNQHMLRHSNERRYECPHCPSKFPCLSDKLKHMKIHNKTKKFFCETCGSSFSRSDSLRKHTRIHTGDKPFKCECGMSFVFSYHLQRHKRTHSGEKPFKCDYCKKDFVEKVYLYKHLRQHLGENIHVCQRCPQAFKYDKELRDHEAEH